MARKLCIGDIHGGYKALLQCLEWSRFDKENDTLIVLGDIVDSWPDVRECIDELLTIKNLIYIIGNHDKWALDWLKRGDEPLIWVTQGGTATINSFYKLTPEERQKYIHFFESAHLYYELDNKLFVHGGINWLQKKENWDPGLLMWDRDLLNYAYHLDLKKKPKNIGNYTEIFVGHTTTELYKSLEPIHFCNVWDLDTGGGWSGKLTIMDIDTHQYWQSNYVYKLYPDVKGRGE